MREKLQGGEGYIKIVNNNGRLKDFSARMPSNFCPMDLDLAALRGSFRVRHDNGSGCRCRRGAGWRRENETPRPA